MTVTFESRDAIAHISIQRPERKNAVDRNTATRLLEAYRRFEADESLCALVVSGTSDAFCAGADLKALDNDVDSPAGPMGFTRLHSKKPTLAAIEGWCVAGGLEIAIWCDLRIAAESAKLGCLERRFGVPLIDGGTQRLPRIVGLGRALDLVLTGRVLSATEAERIGLVNRVVPDGNALAAAHELAREIVSYPYSCLLADRESLYDSLSLGLPAGLALEAERGKGVLTEAAKGAREFADGAGRHGKPPAR
jgi:enoyl-CoA hydratase